MTPARTDELLRLADEIEAAIGMTIRTRRDGVVKAETMMAAHREAIVAALRAHRSGWVSRWRGKSVHCLGHVESGPTAFLTPQIKKNGVAKVQRPTGEAMTEGDKRFEVRSGDAVTEWQEARKAFLAVDHASPKDFDARKPLFDRLADAEGALMKLDARASAQAAWMPIETAPKNATEILLLVPRGSKGWPTQRAVVGHWADGGGDEQPRFRGWFYDTGYGYADLGEPTHWAPLNPMIPERGGAIPSASRGTGA